MQDLLQKIEHLTSEEKKKLFAYLQNKKKSSRNNEPNEKEITQYSAIGVAEKKEYYPLSAAQKRLFFLNRLEEDKINYNIWGAIILDGDLDILRLEEVFKTLIGRHESLRTSFELIDGEPVQKIHPVADFQITRVQLEETCVNKFIKEFIQPFRLDQAPLIRVGLIEISSRKHILITDMHHIISDGISLKILINEFCELYHGKKPPELRIQYKDFSEWQNKLSMSDYIKRQEKFWIELYEGEIPVLNLPTDFPRPPRQMFEGNLLKSKIGANLTDNLHKLAKETNTTLFMILFAAYNILLSKYTGQDDVIIGIPTAGRQHTSTENIIGMFANTLAVRNRISTDKTFREFLEDIKSNLIKVYNNQDYQFESLVEKLNLSRDLARNPLFDVMFTYQNMEDAKIELSDLKITPYESERKVSKFDLTFITLSTNGEISLAVEYCTWLFKIETVERLISHYSMILEQITLNPDIGLSEVSLLTEKERRQVLFDFNNTEVLFFKDKTVYELFEEQVEKTPDNTAVIFNNEKLTYRELNKKSNQIARLLRDKGVGPNCNAGIIIERSLEMVIGVMGILKSGGAYLPIDSDYPEERIKYLLNDSSAIIILTSKKTKNIINMEGKELLAVDEILLNNEYSVENLNLSYPVDRLMYTLYTSGSTGNPKGVMVKCNAFTNLLNWFTEEFYINNEDNVLLIASLGFDLAQKNLYAALIKGGKLCLFSAGKYNYNAMANVIEKEKITLINCTPSAIQPLIDISTDTDFIKLKSLRYIYLGGEVINPKKLELWIKSKNYHGNIVNTYGPTECTDIAAFYIIKNQEILQLLPVPIGRPIYNTRLYVLDKDKNLLPIGIAGELYIGGIGVAKGYYNNPELTKEKFIKIDNLPESIVYKSGDMARWLPDGNLEFLGRVDHQVKLRGFRIELGEIETQLLKHEGVNEAIVITKEDTSGSKYLCAYLEVKNEQSIHEIKDHLAKTLPSYMIPSFFVQLEKMPLTPNGKIDRKSLPEPKGEVQTKSEYVAPRTESENKLSAVWQEVLGIQKVGIKDNFFELGGHSLKAINLVSRIHKAFNKEIPLEEIFNNPTIEGLAMRIEKQEDRRYFSIQPVKAREYYSLSSAQKRLFFMNQLENNSTSYNIPGAILIEGEINKSRLEDVFQTLLRRHDAFRTSFEIVNGEPVQRIHSEIDFNIQHISSELEAIPQAIRGFIRPFDLSQAPLLRVGLIEISAEKCILIYDMHHIISDGTSMAILIHEFADLYEGKYLKDLRLRYADYVVWQTKLFSDGTIKKQESFWLKQFEDQVPILNLPGDFPRPVVQSFEGGRFGFKIDKQLTDRIVHLAAENEATVYMVLLSAFYILLYKYTGQEDIVIGSPIAGRTHADLEKIIGVFVNTLALRNSPSGAKTYKEFLREVRENTLKAYENQDYQFEELVEKLDLKRDLSRNPLFDVMFIMQNIDMNRSSIGRLCFEQYPLDNKTSKFDISLQVFQSEGNISLSFEYCVKIFKKDTIERLAEHLKYILESIVLDPEIELEKIEILNQNEKSLILNDFNCTQAEYSDHKVIHEMFEKQADRFPDKTALIFGKSRMTYMELNEKANQVARKLKKMGVKPEDIVAILVERSFEMLIGILGILKAGGAYLPIDPDYPDARIKYMLDDSKASVLLIKSGTKRTVEFDGQLLDLDNEELYQGDNGNLMCEAKPDHLAYVLYTSGSTGKPKGVMVEHGSVANILLTLQKEYPLCETDSYLLKTTYTFDVSVTELFGWFFGKGKLVILGAGEEKEPDSIIKAIRVNKITHVNFVPSMLAALLNWLNETGQKEPNSLKYVFVAGEAISAPTVEKFYQTMKGINLENLYGPTEATIYATRYSVTGSERGVNIPIGKPLSNIRTYIVNQQNQLQPVGIFGELCIAGVGLARGYLNQLELTNKKLVTDPFEPEGMMYRTGDLARWLPDGNIEFSGRIDHQVKIRGNRIELGEIEAQLLRHSEVREALVIAKEDASGNNYLCAYLSGKRELSSQELRTYLSGILPEYMIPAYFVQMEKLPLSSNGKIDRKALCEPDSAVSGGVDYAPPRNDMEKRLVDIWQEVLGAKHIGIDDNFFTLGGDSIKSLQISARLYQYGIKFDIKDLFRHPTIGELSSFIRIDQKEINQEPVIGEVCLTPIQRWFFSEYSNNRSHFNQFVMLKSDNEFDEGIIKHVFTKIIEHHDALRMVYREKNGGIEQFDCDLSGKLFDFMVFDFTNTDDYEGLIEEKADYLQRNINLQFGPMVKLGLFKTRTSDQLLIIIHHLVVDGISWRIILEDFTAGYLHELRNEPIQFPSKTHPYKEWAAHISDYTGSPEELDFWQKQEKKKVGSLIKKLDDFQRKMKDNRHITIEILDDYTEKLLKESSRAYNTEINDLLLTALGIAIRNWTKADNVLISLEGHGREEIIDELNISRTVGWFTSIYPVILEMTESDSLSRQIKVVKETLRNIPNKGVGYGILRYLCRDQKLQNCNLKPEVSFNYLGQFSQEINTELFKVISSGTSFCPELEQQFAIDISGIIANGKLVFTFSFNRYEFDDETIRHVAEDFRENLQAIITHCSKKIQIEYTPDDFENKTLSIDELDQIIGFFDKL